MKHFLSTTALIAIIGTAGYADNHSGAFIEYKVTSETDLFASELIGMRVYAAEANMDAATPVSEGARAEWDDIGEINEIVLTRDGQVAAVIVGVGGFLGIGERDVAINMAELSVMHEDGESDDFFLVVQSSREMVENAPAFENAEMGNAETEMSDSENAQAAENAMEQPVMAAPKVEREGYAIAEREQLTAEMLTGARVYGANDEDVGEVSEILISDDGQIESVVIDVGGFLGIGERPVALTFDELTILRNEGGDDFRVYIDATQEALEKRPEYEG
ncbi:PRC-barrel domain-containing protein [Aliiroseovarius sp. Z3]|uniref:PRC-barrel domain-containing protein n=1 Tax=Aliiroseovarius sp. Z3 TaxID=2811402 RepID=UPI0023B22AAE|nr:PRC-barrel domain-containing protein [Aliiroseovarius sp. Z3]MDE9449943.1 PRC-barrel domain-containing protein [Aliiroseovarius sp. Z3]